MVIPALNEARALKANIPLLVEYLGTGGELVVVDDGSSDTTTEVVAAAERDGAGIMLLSHPSNLGKGAAVRTGMLAASGGIRIFCDADVAYGVDGIAKVRDALAGADVAIGSRAATRRLLSAHPIRALASRLFAAIVRETAGYDDTQCGLKGFTAEAADALFGRARIDGFGFDVELLCLASAAGYRIVEVPVEEGEKLPGRRSSVRVVPAAFGMLRDVFAIRRNLRNDGGAGANR